MQTDTDFRVSALLSINSVQEGIGFQWQKKDFANNILNKIRNLYYRNIIIEQSTIQNMEATIDFSMARMTNSKFQISMYPSI